MTNTMDSVYTITRHQRKLQGDDLIRARIASYNQLCHVERNRRLTMGERKQQAQLKAYLIKQGIIKE